MYSAQLAHHDLKLLRKSAPEALKKALGRLQRQWRSIQKVVQAAGRVIRTPADRGVVYLIDERYARRQVLGLLPAWWQANPATSRA